jgi:hypothetical protein
MATPKSGPLGQSHHLEIDHEQACSPARQRPRGDHVLVFRLPAGERGEGVVRQADDSYSMAKKQAKSDEKAALAQCDTKSGEAKEQCKKDAKANHDKTMADAEATHDKAKADYKAKK